MRALFWASLRSGPGRLPPAHAHDALKKTIASYWARFAVVKIRGFLSAWSQLLAAPPLRLQSSQSTV